MQQVRAGLPARGDSRQGVRTRRARRGAGDLQVDRRTKGSSSRADKYTIQVAPEDCTGCNLCVEVCPAKDKANPRHKAINMQPQPPLREAERSNYTFFLDLPEIDRASSCADRRSRARSS